MDARKDLFFVILIFAGLWIVWFSTGGPERATSKGGLFLYPPAPLGTGQVYGPSSQKGDSLEGRKSIEREIEKVQRELEQVAEELEKLEFKREESPYKGMISIERSTVGPRAADVNKEYVVLKATRQNNQSVRITGWTIESLITKRSMKIGEATILPRSGVVNSESPLYLPPGEKVIISTSRSPIGSSFRTNKCTGYFEQFQDFTPRLMRSCPYPEDELVDFSTIPFTDDSCYDYVDRLPRCQMVLDALPPNLSNSCNIFINENISYTGCIENHRNDPDFFGKEWRVFLNRDEELWREKREILRLLDNNGKTVDVFTY